MNFVTLPFLGLVHAMSAMTAPRASHRAVAPVEAPRKRR